MDTLRPVVMWFVNPRYWQMSHLLRWYGQGAETSRPDHGGQPCHLDRSRGISPVNACKLVRAFGEKVFGVIEAEPERLREVIVIGRVPVRCIADAWAEQYVVREIMMSARCGRCEY